MNALRDQIHLDDLAFELFLEAHRRIGYRHPSDTFGSREDFDTIEPRKDAWRAVALDFDAGDILTSRWLDDVAFEFWRRANSAAGYAEIRRFWHEVARMYDERVLRETAQ